MINKNFIKKLKKDYDEKISERRQIISLSNVVLHDSKKIIFSLHRQDIKRADDLLANTEKILINLEKKFGHARLLEEGAYKAAVEEYVEAKMFYKVLNGEKVDKIDKINLEIESLIGGISDLTGELVRVAVNKASAGEFDQVKKISDAINEILSELVEFDITGYLRTKYDQAKTNLRKIEQICYEIKIRR